MKTIITLLLIGLSAYCTAQGISGRVFDEKKEPIVNAVVQVFSQGGILVGGNVTDYDGNYLVKPPDAGYYKVVVLNRGYDTSTITNVVVTTGGITNQRFILAKCAGLCKNITAAYRRPLIDQDENVRIITTGEPSRVPTVTLDDLSAQSNYIHHGCGGGPALGGARASGTQYIIDGVMIRPTVHVPVAVLPETNANLHSRLANPSIHRFSHDELAAMPLMDLRDAIGLLPGVYQARRGDDLNIFGDRVGGTQYTIDGMRR